MDINDWANPEVVQLLEQYIQEPTESTKELQRKIQRITGKALTINKLRHHLQQFEKETAAYKEHSKKNETSVTVSSCQAGSRFEQRAQLPQEMSSSKPAEIDQREARTGHVPDDVQTVNSHTHKSQKVVRSIRKISTRRREELGMLRSYQKCKRKKSKNASSTTVSDKQKDLTATTACEGVKQEAAEQQKTVPPVKFITKSDETTVSPPDESAVLILSESSKSTVIKTQPERAILPAQSAIPASNIGTPECATALAIGPAIPALKILKISERAVLNTKSTDLVSDSPEWVVIIDTKLNVPPRNTLECVLDAEPTVPARTTPERVVLDAEPVNLVLDTPEHVALTTGPIVPIRNTVLATASVVPASNRDTPKREALDAEPTNLVSPVHVSSAIGSIIPVSNIPVVIGPSVPVSNIPECAVLVTGPITVVSNTPEYVVQATKPTVADATSCSQVTTGKNIAWYGSVVPQSIARGLTASESNRCAGSEMQSNLSSQQFQSMTTHLDHCLNALRLLRNEVISVHRRIMEGSWENDPADGEKTLEERLDFINQIYDNLESHAKQLPTSTPMTVQMERLSRFLHDGQIDPYTSELYDKALESSTWMETNNQLLQMYAEFLRTVVGNRRRSIMTDRPISYSNYGLNSSPQSIFEQTLTVVLKDPNIKKIGLVGRYLERSTLSALVEFKFGQVVDKQYVCLLKMLMVVNSGVPEFVQMIAPHEEWSYLDVGCGQVDIHKESRYLVYRKMSVQANIHLMQTIMPCIDIRNAHTLSYVLNLFAKFSGVFDIKCRVCKKIMKDYLPPLMFDLRCPKNALHESCR